MKIQNNQQGVITDASQNNQQGVITGQNEINKFLSVQKPVLPILIIHFSFILVLMVFQKI